MPVTSIRALLTNPNDSCSNDNEKMNKDGPCLHRPQDFISWSLDTESASADNGESISGYSDQNGYLVDEQWISCVSDSEPNLNGDDYLVQAFNFIYEIYTPADDSREEVLDTLTNFERNLSLGVSDALGLVHCAGSLTQLSVARSAGFWVRRSLTSHRFLDEDSASGVLAVSMMPQDEIDDASACASAVETDEPAACSHVVGGMTAWISKTDDASSISNSDVFLNAVESYIKDDSSKYLGNGLLHVEYIAELDSDTYATNLGTSDGDSEPSFLLGLALAGLFFVAVGFGGTWILRKKQRNKNDDEVVEKSEALDEDQNDDIQLQETEEVTSFEDEAINKSIPSAYDLSNIHPNACSDPSLV